VEYRSRSRRLLSVLKMRDSDFDNALREFAITDQGIVLGGNFEGAQEVLSGFAREPAQSEGQDRPSSPGDT
jgi:circadian clock protein KaiC